jgi:hypothetical protein
LAVKEVMTLSYTFDVDTFRNQCIQRARFLRDFLHFLNKFIGYGEFAKQFLRINKNVWNEYTVGRAFGLAPFAA